MINVCPLNKLKMLIKEEAPGRKPAKILKQNGFPP